MLKKLIATLAATLALGHAAAAEHPAFKVDVTGKGAPIILIPGLGSAGDVWDGTVAHYCADGKYQAIVRGGLSDRLTVIDAMADMTATDLRQDISRIKAPTLVLGTWIAYKDYAPKAAITNVFTTQYAQLKGAKIEIADNARHFIMYDDPAWMYDRIDNFLN